MNTALLVLLCAVVVALVGYAMFVTCIAGRAMLWESEVGGRARPQVWIVVSMVALVLAALMVLSAALVVLR